MKKWTLMVLSLIWFGKPMHVQAQLSPGELSEAHAHLEGISNCTQCHEIGQKVTNQKCLACHTFLDARIRENRGYHASSEITDRECIECHSDHHGRKFEMVRFDRETFDHTLTGYELEGAHGKLECRQCHKAEFIVDNEIRGRTNTYLGLDTDCLNCHEDVHRRTLSFDCRSCHDMQAFKPASRFDHADTDFPLKGKHESVDCASCHAIETVDGSQFQQFSGIAFAQCSDCHDDAHNGRLGPDCASCHTEDSFNTFMGKATFDHRSTSFPLRGKHRTIDCASCHDQSTSGRNAFREFEQVAFNQCSACHEDVHQGKFGADCKSCHNENSFQTVSNISEFDHSQTDFALKGKHQSIDCKACHIGAMTDPVAFNQCSDCHEDRHEGEFTSTMPVLDCAACHQVEGFAPSTFSLAQHDETPFPLTGAHVATPCFACHLDEEKWDFRGIGNECRNCHEDIHEGLISEQYYPEEDCALCHSTGAWNEVSFDHSRTSFALEGAHANASCSSCHFEEQEGAPPKQEFAGLTHACDGCHHDVHRGQFADVDGTDCSACHGFVDWSADRFDHDSTKFRLEGAHATIDCIACHRETVENGEGYILFKIEKFECIDCHQ